MSHAPGEGRQVSLRPAGASRIGLAVRMASMLLAASAFQAASADGPQSSPALRLPAAIAYASALGPDSTVSFSHDTHVALAGNRCLGCHPAPFRMLKPSHRTSHAEMRSGRSCGVCHDGKKAFGVTDSSACRTCHAGSLETTLAAKQGSPGALRSDSGHKLPRDLTFVRGESSPGLVTFRHPSHVRASTACAACHPARFAMKASGGKPGGVMHEPGACGGCHDGKRTFGVEDPAACEHCHAGTKATP